MTDSWDWKVNITEIAIAKSANPLTGTYPPALSGGAMWSGLPGDEQIYTYGGTYFQLNSTFGNVYADPATYTLWSYAKGANTWNQYDISSASTERPGHGAYAEAPDQGLGFYLGGQLDNGSEQASSGFTNYDGGIDRDDCRQYDFIDPEGEKYLDNSSLSGWRCCGRIVDVRFSNC